MKNIISILILFCVSLNTTGQIYKCESPGGDISYVDKPCSSNDITVFTKKEEAQIKTLEEFARVYARLIENKSSENPDFAKAMESMAMIESLKIYSFKHTIIPFIEGCKKVDDLKGKELENEYNKFLVEMKDYIVVGEKIYESGLNLTHPEVKSVSHAELEESLNRKVAEIKKKFDIVDLQWNSQKYKECTDMIKAVNLMKRKIEM